LTATGLTTALEQLGIDPGLGERFDAHLALVRHWNRSFNLVSAKDTQRLESRHLLDSLALLPWMRDSRRLLDIGSGAGFPGIALAIASAIPTVLVERSAKKARFLTQVVLELGLEAVEVVCCDVRKYESEGTFDTVTARAVADPETIWAMARPHLSTTGRLLLQTGGPVAVTFPGGIVQDSTRKEIGWITAIGLERLD